MVGRPIKRTASDGSRHAKGCVSCPSCRGRKNRSNGNVGQREAARRAGVKKAGSFFAGHEEQYDGPTRIEVKVGAQIKPMVTAFDKCKAQSEVSRPVGDSRPFVLHVRPLPNGKRQLTTFESNSDDEYKQAIYALAVHAGVIDE